MSVSSEDRISTFERHCGLLLRAYPAAYRSERGEEIVGTLLETTPEGSAWPLPRDIRGLVIGGLSARAALNRRNTTAANLRIAVVVGLTAYFAFNAASVLHFLLLTAGQPRLGAVDWSQVLVPALSTASASIAWVSRRRAVVLVGALPAAVACAMARPWGPSYVFVSAVTNLAFVAVLIALARRERPSRQWLWPVSVVFLAEMLLQVTAGVRAELVLACVLSLVFASIVWLAVDARPVIALVVFVLALYLPVMFDQLASGFIPPMGGPLLAICSPLAALAIWRLRRQSAHAGRPTRI
jgi:hypothetical protein